MIFKVNILFLVQTKETSSENQPHVMQRRDQI